MEQYLRLLKEVLETGEDKPDRTGTGAKSIFGYQLRFALESGFPLLTTKKLHLKSIIHELLWFLRGDSNVASLQRYGISIWDAWADQDGNLGPIYGVQWRSWPTADGQYVDQISTLIDNIKRDPNSRRLLVSAWNVGELSKMALSPCHVLFQFHVGNGGKLSCQLYQRSADIFLGLPFNIASYALLTLMVAQVTNLQPKDLVITLGDAHLYHNHCEQAKLQLSRSCYALPIMKLNPTVRNIFSFEYQDFILQDYTAHPHISAPIAV